jgi:ATP-dependent Clp protease ATP-binding subunit ClpC
MIRLDMSEYMEKHSVSKLIGSPPGYTGYGDGGLLTEKVRRSPYSLVLFDEIEKAHPDVFNILLQILDDGNLTDSQGRRVDFRNCIVILTTNLGAKSFGETGRVGFSSSTRDDEECIARERVENELRHAFRPEFLNRIDEIIFFRALDGSDLGKIASLILSDLTDRIENRGIFIEFDKSVIDAMVKNSNKEFGARPLRRAAIKLIETPFSEAILSGKVSRGDFIIAKFDGERVIFEKKSSQ